MVTPSMLLMLTLLLISRGSGACLNSFSIECMTAKMKYLQQSLHLRCHCFETILASIVLLLEIISSRRMRKPRVVFGLALIFAGLRFIGKFRWAKAIKWSGQPDFKIMGKQHSIQWLGYLRHNGVYISDAHNISVDKHTVAKHGLKTS
ncbi:hypothetical protein Tco_0986375, partial [Tanacetum coccineum]